MKVSYRWLASFFPAGALEDTPPEELARRLTAQGLAVDELRPAFPHFEGVVLGKVVDAGPHPNADRLTLCRVESGDGDRQVVCGAPNVEVGAIYGYATVGSRLPGDRAIRRAKIRGVESQGMLCSAPELGLDALGGAEGIWRIRGAADADLGRDLRDVLALDDTILDVDVSSNRGDALSHLGIAREAQWIVGADLTLPEVRLVESGEPAASRAGVEIRDAEGCPRYLGRLIDGVQVGPSPAWLQTRLLSVGQRSVSDVVDVTNYVMLELGQPLHPFDWERLAGGRIVVRRSAAGERFVTLDGKERTLDEGITMICDADRPVAVGGVMGGLESEISERTRTVFLEGAHFEPARIARAVRRLGLPSEASTRFARGVDPRLPEIALDRAAALIAEVSGGTVAPGRVDDEASGGSARPRIALRLTRYAALIGSQMSEERAREALETLGFAVSEGTQRGDLAIEAPSWRFDIAREVDVIEEIARLEGYGRVPAVPLPVPSVAAARGPRQRLLARVSEAARGAGFDEASTTSFVGEGGVRPAGPIDNLVEIRNPISKADRFLRPYVVSNLARAVAYNLNRGATRAKLFEIGHAFLRDGDDVAESERLALAAGGARFPIDWTSTGAAEYEFWDLKGDVEDVLASVAGIETRFAPGGAPWLHPGRQAEIEGGGARLGFCGEVHPSVAAEWGCDQRLLVAEFDLSALEGPANDLRIESWSREPIVQRDLALVVPEGDTAGEILEAVWSAGIEHLEAIRVFDRYVGPQLPEGHYSLGLRLTFEADRTLTDEEVDGEMQRLLEALRSQRGYGIR